jgi:3'-5' exoribonuclease
MFAELEGFVASVAVPHLKALLAAFFADAEVVGAFKRAPAAKGFHHVYIGGLLEHTLSVVRLLDVASRHYEGVDRDLLLAGGILHDIGKIREYRYEGLIDYSDEGRLIGHIVIGVEMLDEKIATLEAFPPETAMALRHILLSHHGEMEFGSPKRPKTLEAMIVHQLDDLDAKVNAIQGFVADAPDDASAWTPFHRLFGRFLYKGKPD